MSRPEGSTPLFDAWNRMLDYAEAAGALTTTGNYQRDVDRGRSIDQSHGLAQAYGLNGDDLTNLAIYCWQMFADQVARGVDPINAFAAVGVSMVLTGAEVTRDPRSELPGPTPESHKRDVLLDFCSNPDAALNALHQAGWKVVPK